MNTTASTTALAHIRAIAKRELSSYFGSPVAYVFLVFFLLLTGFFTFTVGSFFERGEAGLASFFTWHPWLYLVLCRPSACACGPRNGAPVRSNCC